MLVGLVARDARLEVLEQVEDADQAVVARDPTAQPGQQVVSEEAFGGTRQYPRVLATARRSQDGPPPPLFQRIAAPR